HLLMIGGPTDIVVEPNIVRAMAGRDQSPPRPGLASPEPQVRVAPAAEAAGWGDGDSQREGFEPAEPQMPEPPPRPARPSFVDELRRPASERRLDRGDPLAGFSPEPMGCRTEPRPEGKPPRWSARVLIVSRPSPMGETANAQ